MNARVWKVTGALVITGVVVGAIAGMAALIPVALQQRLAPNPDDGLVGPLSSWLFLTGGIGAATGAIAAPILGMGLLRSVALWRVVLEPAVGAIVGGMVGWLIVRNDQLLQLFGPMALVWCSAIGALLAGLFLRWRYRQRVAVVDSRAVL